jgi:putative membrane protein
MSVPVRLLIGFIALLHLYFMWFEIFAWTSLGKKIFKSFPSDLFEPTRKLAANQGLYNGFLAAGLIWSLLIGEGPWNFYVAVFFLSCVLIAGIFGAISVHRKIFFVQALPAFIALFLMHVF